MNAHQNTAQVALLCMPFQSIGTPSLALALLKSLLTERHIEVDVHHLHLRLAAADIEAYEAVNSKSILEGEWLFSDALNHDATDGFEQRLGPFVRRTFGRGHSHTEQDTEQFIGEMSRLRAHVDSYLDECVQSIDWTQYKIVGFSSTFQQNVASLALAKRLKSAFPHLYIIFGGSNCEGIMGEAIFEEFEFVDGVCNGEGDRVFPEFVEEFLQDKPPRYLAGLLDRRQKGRDTLSLQLYEDRQPFDELDSLPYPDYSDFWPALDETPYDGLVRLHFETSRGCWWGQKHHCTFCGLNGQGMRFRTKSPERAVEEIRALHDEHLGRVDQLCATDDIIPIDYSKTVLPHLDGLDITLFYETKSNLGEEQIRAFRDAGVLSIQPGIESLDTGLLKLMRKGVTAIQNVQCLKLCRQFGVVPQWSVLYCFPMDAPGDYMGQIELYPKLHHFHPPLGGSPIHIHRFSPYQFEPDTYGIEHLRPAPAYADIYRTLDAPALQKIAYTFVGDYSSKAHLSDYLGPLLDSIEWWRRESESAELFYMMNEERIVITDLRAVAVDRYTVLQGRQKQLFQLCDRIRKERAVISELGLDSDPNGTAILKELVAPLIQKGLMMKEKDRYLSLAIKFDGSLFDTDGYSPSPEAWTHFETILGLLDGSTT